MTAQDLDVQTVATPERGTLLFQGDLDAHSAPRLEREVRRLVDAGLHSICLDLTLVEFVDSTGLGTLIGAHKGAREAGVGFELVPSERMAKLLRRTGLLGYFGLASSS